MQEYWLNFFSSRVGSFQAFGTGGNSTPTHLKKLYVSRNRQAGETAVGFGGRAVPSDSPFERGI